VAIRAFLRRIGPGRRTLATVWLVIGVGLFAGSAASLYLSTQNYALTAYNSAPACVSAEDLVAGKDCRYTGTATVSGITPEWDGSSIYFDLSGQYIPYFRARLAYGTPQIDSLSVGGQVTVEVWRSRVTRLAGAATLDNPVNDPIPGTLRVIGFLLAIVGAVVTVRKPGRTNRGDDGPQPSLAPVGVSDALWR
jgi:hypothetical protein